MRNEIRPHLEARAGCPLYTSYTKAAVTPLPQVVRTRKPGVGEGGPPEETEEWDSAVPGLVGATHRWQGRETQN